MKRFQMRLKVFNSDATFYKFLNIALIPVMVLASGIALVIYVSAMALTILVIQFVGLVLGAYSFLKWILDASVRAVGGVPARGR